MFTLLAVVLYAVPIALLVAMRSERERPLWAIGLDLPLAVALDLLLVLTLTLGMRLGIAVLAARVVWLAIAAAVIVWRRRQLAWPEALDVHTVGAVVGAAVVAVALSMVVSQSCHVFDRAWHIPLVTSMLGQTLPFHNVYQPESPLEYHYSGNVVAAAIQALSFGHMHASLALSVAHDVFFGLVAAAGAFIVRGLGVRSIALTLLGALAPLLGGPTASPYSGGHPSYRGYSFVNFYQVSFRPHSPVAALLIVGFVGAIVVALSRRDGPTGARTWTVLVASTAALTLTDEASTGILGLALGAIWLVAPVVIHPKRVVGVAVFGALFVALLAPHYAFGGTLAPGSLPQHPVFVAWQNPGFLNRPVSLARAKGVAILLLDVLPLLLLVLGAVVTLLQAHRTREHTALVVGLAVMFVVTVALLCGVEVRAKIPVPRAGWAGQNHRFVTALLVSAPLLLAAALTQRSTAPPRRAIRIVALGLGVLSLGISGVSTLVWTLLGSHEVCTQPKKYLAFDDFFTVDCKRDTGATTFGAPPRVVYGAGSILYTYAGCNSTYLPGPRRLDYRMKIGLALVGRDGLTDVSKMIKPTEPLTVLCPRRPGYPSDEICDVAMRRSRCTPSGQEILACELSAEERRALLPRLPLPRRGPRRTPGR